MFQVYDKDTSAPTTDQVFCMSCGHTHCTHAKSLLHTAVRVEQDVTYPVGFHSESNTY